MPRVAPAVTNIAHTFHVNTTNDTHATAAAITGHVCHDAAGHCSLRAATEVVNGDVTHNYLVIVPANAYILLPAHGTIEIKGNVVVSGAGSATTIISAAGCGCGVFLIDGTNNSVQMSGLAVGGGATTYCAGIYIGAAAVSIAASFVSPSTPCLDVLYGLESGAAMKPTDDDVLTIAPDPWGRMTCSSCLRQSQTPLRFTPMTRSQSASGSVSMR